MNKMFLVNGRTSEIPTYWTAHYADKIINQIDDNGYIMNKWSTLSLDSLEYWGIISNLGCYGFYPKHGICDLNGTKVRLDEESSGKITYKRTILSSSEGWTRTKSAEIGFGNYVVTVYFLPESNIVFGRRKELTGKHLTEFE
jgi:hypothetical protein